MNHKKTLIADAPSLHNPTKAKLIAPRLLSKRQAAAFCGMSIESFSGNCDVMPIRVQPGLRGLRYDIEDLADWIERKKTSSEVQPLDLIEALGRDQD